MSFEQAKSEIKDAVNAAQERRAAARREDDTLEWALKSVVEAVLECDAKSEEKALEKARNTAHYMGMTAAFQADITVRSLAKTPDEQVRRALKIQIEKIKSKLPAVANVETAVDVIFEAAVLEAILVGRKEIQKRMSGWEILTSQQAQDLIRKAIFKAAEAARRETKEAAYEASAKHALAEIDRER